MSSFSLPLLVGAMLCKQAQTAPPTPDQLARARAFALLRKPDHESFVASSTGPRGKDSRGIPTIGYGINLNTSRNKLQKLFGPERTKQLYAGQPINRNEARQAVMAELDHIDPIIRKRIPGWTNLSPDMRGAIYSGGVNNTGFIGPKFSGLVNKAVANPQFSTNPGSVPALRKATSEWAYGHKDQEQGLVKRRVYEANVMRKSYGMPPLPTPTTWKEVPQFYRKHMNQAPAANGKGVNPR